jgi:hypothetical protein
MRSAEVSDAVKALKTVLGDREYNSRRGFYNFYIRQMIDAYGQQGVAEGEENKYGSQENWDSLRKDIKSQYPYKKGTTVTVPHKGKLVNGEIVRYEAGEGGYSPAYVVDIGEYESIMVQPNKVRRGVAEGEFAGDYATGEAGQWRNKGPKAHKPATIGDLVGEGEEKDAEKKNNPLDPWKHVSPRVTKPKIRGTDNYAKSGYYPQKISPVKKLDKPLANETVAEGSDDLARILNIAGIKK